MSSRLLGRENSWFYEKTGVELALTLRFHSQPPPALRYPNYRGCLELDTLNEEVVSLYNFQHTFQLDTTAEKPCAR